jgi:hypothetical protein
MKVRFAALAGFVLASALPQLGHAQGYIQIPIPGIPGVGPAPPPQEREYRGWREHCDRLRDREHDLRDRLAYMPPYSEERGNWSTGLAKCITSESSAGTVENQNRSDRTPGDETLLARFGRCQPTSGTGPFSTLKTGPPDYVMLPRGSVGAACVQLVHRRDPRPSTVFRRIPT